MPTPSLHFEIHQGLTFAGFQLLALDSAGAAVVQSEGTTYLCQVRSAAGNALSFDLSVVRGTEAAGQILIEEASAAETAAFPVGSYVYDIVPIDTDDKPWPPILKGTIKVIKPVSLPA